MKCEKPIDVEIVEKFFPAEAGPVCLGMRQFINQADFAVAFARCEPGFKIPQEVLQLQAQFTEAGIGTCLLDHGGGARLQIIPVQLLDAEQLHDNQQGQRVGVVPDQVYGMFYIEIVQQVVGYFSRLPCIPARFRLVKARVPSERSRVWAGGSRNSRLLFTRSITLIWLRRDWLSLCRFTRRRSLLGNDKLTYFR